MEKAAQFVMFLLGWAAVMAIIAFACWLIGRWGKNRSEKKPEEQPEEGNE